MTFLFDASLKAAIAKIAAEDNAMCAVAFWGQGSKALLSEIVQARIICNLASGGTNPSEIEQFDLSRTKQMNDLHAKVYIGHAEAVVTSANASSNGLGLQGVEQANWQEAGFLTHDIEPLRRWFETLWNEQARQITSQDIKVAKAAWNKRRIAKPTLLDFRDFDPDGDEMPLIDWGCATGSVEWDVAAIENQIGREVDENFQARLDWGREIDYEAERKIFENGRWVFVFTRRKDGLVANKSKPSWTFLQGSLRKSAFYSGSNEAIDWALQAESMPLPPFVLNSKFISAFSTSLAKEKYEPIRDKYYKRPYFKTHENLMRDLWRDTHASYLKNDDTIEVAEELR